MTALTPSSKFGRIQQPTDLQIPKSSVLENLGIGAKQGFEETTIAYAKDYNLLQRARSGEDDIIPFDEWNESNPYYREDISWSEDLSWNIARNIQDEFSLQEEALAITERATGLGKVARFGGMFAGAALDPINFIPFTFWRSKIVSPVSHRLNVCHPCVKKDWAAERSQPTARPNNLSAATIAS